MKDKAGKEITFKEFIQRWKEGIINITPIQKLTNEIRGAFITLLGFILSFIAIIFLREKIGWLAYGLILIFLGNIITTFLKWNSLKQQLIYFKRMEEESEEIERRTYFG